VQSFPHKASKFYAEQECEAPKEEPLRSVLAASLVFPRF
jgi:hypothetical protein